MARKQKPRATAPKRVTRKLASKKVLKKVLKKAARKVPRKAVSKPKTARKPLKTKKMAKKKVARVVKGAKRTKRMAKAAVSRVKKAAPKAAKAKKAPRTAKPAPKSKARAAGAVMSALLPRLDRERRRLPEAELEDFVGTGTDERLLRSARSGHDELRSELQKHTEASLELTAGDVDANWQDAYAIGDEAPGGDSPTPDQDRVDDIGKALGVVYEDDEELMGGEEIAERDTHRWELDPGSKDDEEI